VDRIALLPEFERLSQAGSGNRRSPENVSARILKILRSMDQASLLRRDLRLNAFVRHKVADHSRLRLERLIRTERSLLSMLAEADPEPEGWVPLALRPLNQRLLDEGCESTMELVRALLRSLSEDGKGFAGSHGSLELRFIARDAYRVRVVRSWRTIEELAGRRQQVASLILEVLAARIPADQAPRADVLVEFGFDEISTALDRHSGLRAEVRDVEAAIERALMYLHEQSVIVLQQGLAIFRSAMTLRLSPERGRDRYRASDFEPLRHHYRERMLQIHVMAEYARRGLQRIQDAQALVSAYFALRRKEFLHRYFRTQPQLLEHATTADSFRRIVTDLGNTAQIRIVTAPVEGNLLVLAGPGSGKTRTVVHRCAYLLRVERVPARSILVCCFNRHAALEVRRRLVDLVGDDARGVLVQTYHGLALRFLGRSLATPGGAAPEVADLDRVILDAVALLEGRELPPGMESDELRDRLLAGFRHILVDEYQDIDEPQYAMISAIAGRKVADADQRLSIMAVGDDDQNIYAFRGANVRFIGKFREDYGAEVHYLVENHRSTRYLIEAANQLIGLNADRMKSEYPIRIDQGRLLLPAGGEFAGRDPVGRGRVRILRVAGGREQALAVIDEVRRLGTLGVSDFSKLAVLAETHRDLAQVRALMEAEKIPIRWLATRTSLPMSRVREVRAVLEWLTQRSRESLSASRIQAAVGAMYPESGQHVWVAFVRRQVEAWRVETNDAEVPAALAREFLLEACAEARHGDGLEQGIALGTVHAAKGTEYDHVLLLGAWVLSGDRQRQEESRRAFYVGMTRARSTLTILHQGQGRPACPDPLEGPAVVREPGRSWDGRLVVPAVRYEEVGLDELDLGFAGRQPAGDPVHAALARLQPGSRLTLSMGEPRRWELADESGQPVVRFSKQGAARWEPRAEFIREIRVLAVLCRSAAMDPDEERRRSYRVQEWEVPVLEIVVNDDGTRKDRVR
jgi:ATP-dependent DNA helicase RecQ